MNQKQAIKLVVSISALILCFTAITSFYKKEEKYGYWPPDSYLPQFCPNWKRSAQLLRLKQMNEPLARYELKQLRQDRAQYERRCK
jgi:hypothetical protein